MTRAPRLIRRLPLLARLQDDTAVVLCDGEVLATSLSIRYHAGLDMDTASAAVHARGYELGSLLGAACDEHGAAWLQETASALWTFPPVHAMDTSYNEFFKSTFSDFSVAESMALSMIAGRLRAARVHGHAAWNAGEGTASLAFKFRLAAIWQVATTLKKISTEQTLFQLGSEHVAELRAVPHTESLAAIFDDGVRALRNVLAHYGIDRTRLHLLNHEDQLMGLPQAFCDGKSWKTSMR